MAAGRQLKAACDGMEWLFPRVPEDALYILNILVSEGMRGQNLGRRLIDEAAAKARRLGFRAVVESRALSLPDGVNLPNHLRMLLYVGVASA